MSGSGSAVLDYLLGMAENTKGGVARLLSACIVKLSSQAAPLLYLLHLWQIT